MDDNFRLKLADFGWSRQKEQERTTFCGTPDYLSPEMINGTEQTEKLDIWTMGVLMFELLHGKAPFSINKKFNPRNKLQEIQKDILKGEIVFARSISEEAKDIVKAMMSPNPVDRPSAYELLTFPFFTSRFPFLASLNVKTSFINSKFFNKSKVSTLYNESGHLHLKQTLSEVDSRARELERKEQELGREKSDLYKRIIEFDKIKEEFKKRELKRHAEMAGFREAQAQLESELMELQEREVQFGVRRESLKAKAEQVSRREALLADREKVLLDKEVELVEREARVDGLPGKE